MTEDNWPEYRLLFEKEMQDSKEFRTEVRLSFIEFRDTLTELKTQRNSFAWISSIVLPILVAALVAYITGEALAGGGSGLDNVPREPTRRGIHDTVK